MKFLSHHTESKYIKELMLVPLSLFLLCVANTAVGQPKELVSFTTASNIISVSIDRAGDFYLVTTDGSLKKYNVDGNLIAEKKYPQALSVFDPTITIRLMAYQKTTQQIDWLSPNLEVLSSVVVDPSFAVEPSLICPSGDKDLWILDHADFSMKKVRPSDLSISIEFILPGAQDTPPLYIRDYQNLLFVLDAKGISMFNSTGRKLKKLDIEQLQGFNFLGEEMYFIQKDQLVLIDLFTDEKRALPLPTPCEQALITEDRIICIQKNKVRIYPFSAQ